MDNEATEDEDTYIEHSWKNHPWKKLNGTDKAKLRQECNEVMKL